MLLSIVESSDYRKWSPQKREDISRQPLGENAECIGPVVGPNVAAMRNRGAQAASGQWLFFKDADCLVDQAKLLTYVRELSQKEKAPGVIGGFYNEKKAGFLQKIYGSIQLLWVKRGIHLEQGSDFVEANHLLGGAFLVRQDIFKKVGGFSEKIGWGGEENHFCIKAQSLGFRTSVSSRIQVEHQNSLNLFGFIKRAWWQSFHKGLYQLHFPKTSTKKISYFNGSLKDLLPKVLFFLVSSAAYLAGSLRASFAGRHSVDLH